MIDIKRHTAHEPAHIDIPAENSPRHIPTSVVRVGDTSSGHWLRARHQRSPHAFFCCIPHRLCRPERGDTRRRLRENTHRTAASARGRLLLVHEQATRTNTRKLCLLAARDSEENPSSRRSNQTNRQYA